MADRGIIFSAPMVRALLDGRKTQTRRLLSPQPEEHEGLDCRRLRFFNRKGVMVGDASPDAGGSAELFTPFAVGDQLYVREAHRLTDCTCTEACRGPGHVWYEADASGYRNVAGNRLRPSIHMPRWASRMTLTVTEVRVQRLQDCTEEDALAEGVVAHETCGFHVPGVDHPIKDFPILARSTAREMYAALWDVLHGSGEWLANPWVVAISFSVEQRNIDAGAA